MWWMGPMIAVAVWCQAGHAQTLRWASQGDLLTLDPHSQNELLTNSINSQVYETLVQRGKRMEIEPGLATDWQRLSPLHWRFRLRPGVKFHDGSALTADDVVFSVQRAQDAVSGVRVYAHALGEARRVDDLTVDFVQSQFNPVFLEHLSLVHVMNKAWSMRHNALRPQDFRNREEKHTAFHANGTGPYRVELRQPDVKTVFKRNTGWWGRFEGNVQDVVYTPVRSDATRAAGLLAGELDLVLDPSPQDLDRLRASAGLRVVDGVENRIIFIGLDQGRDELLYSNVKGKNPFKDVRVRRALALGVDTEALRERLMRGQSVPTGALASTPLSVFNDPDLERRLPHDPARARSLLAEAGYADGFEVTLDCPNNRYVNDEKICIALAAMWTQIGVKTAVRSQPRTLFFPRVEKLDVSLYLLGWGGSITDAETTLTPLMRSRGEGGVGQYNFGNFSNPRLDELAAQSSRETDPARREQLIKAAMREHNEQVHHIPLHRQVIPWAMRSPVQVVHRPDNWLEWRWVTVGSN
jgi:peptide/nickel transport system substrate-binding protein